MDITLSGDEVHVWCVPLDQPASRVKQLAYVLSADEQARSERFYLVQERRRFIVSRSLLRVALARYVDVEPNQLQFCYSPRGKPALLDTMAGADLCFNVSHSQELALFAMTYNQAIGVDLEHIRPIVDVQNIADRFFSAHESATLRVLPPSKLLEGFFNCWTRKEAYVKARGEGLSAPLDEFEVSLAPGEPAKLLRIGGDPREASRWVLRGLAPASTYVAALAVEGHVRRLECWYWPGAMF